MLKKIIAAAAATAVCVSALPALAQDAGMSEVMSEDFESYSVGQVPSGSWAVTLKQDGEITVVQDKDETKGKAAYLYDLNLTASGCVLSRKIPTQRDMMTFQYDYKPGTDSSVSEVSLLSGDVVVTKLALRPTETEGGRGSTKFVYYPVKADGTSSAVSINSSSTGRWFRITFTLDIKKALYSLYIDGEEVVSKERFMNKAASVDGIRFQSSAWQKERLTIDNIKVYAGTPDCEALGITPKIRSGKINYGDSLISEADLRSTHENLADWAPIYSPGGGLEVLEDGEGKYISLKGATIRKAFSPQNGLLSLNMEFKESTAAASSKILLRYGRLPMVEFALKKEDGKSYLELVNIDGSRSRLAEAAVGEWHSLTVNADMEKSIFDAYLDGTQIAKGEGTQRFGDTIDTFAIYGGGKKSSYELAVRNLAVINSDVPKVSGQKREEDTFDNKAPALDRLPDYENFKGVTYDYSKYRNTDGSLIFDAVSADLEKLENAGVHWARISVRLTDNLEETDRIINMLLEHNIKTVLCLRKTNPAKMLGTPEQEAKNIEGYKMLAEKFGDRVSDWEIDNEPNLTTYWLVSPDENGWTGDSVKDYVIYLKGASEAIKSVNPDFNIILGGLSEWLAEDFIDRMGEAQGYLYFDEFCFHPYANTPSEVVGRIKSVKEHIAKWPEPYNSMPMWITEVGFHTNLDWLTPSTVVDELVKAKYLVSVFDKIREEMGDEVRPIFWYAYQEKSKANGYGLVSSAVANGAVTTNVLPALEALGTVDDVTKRVIKAPDGEQEEKLPAEAERISISVDGEILERNGYLKDGIVFLPLRAVFEKLGAEVFWNAETGTARTAKNGLISECFPDAGKAIINGVYVKTDAAPELSEGTLMIPLRFAEEALNIKIDYAEETRTASINSKSKLK